MGKRGERLVIDPADRGWLAGVGLTSVSRLMKYQPERLAAVSESSETFPVELDGIDGAPDVVFVKRYRYRGWGARLGGVFRGTLFGHSRARFEYDFLSEMRKRGVPAVRPIAYGEKRRRGFLAACCLLTEGEPDVVSLDVWLSRKWRAGDLSRAWRRLFVVALAELIRGMHQAGICHGGLFGRNIQVRRKGDAVEFVLLDPDRSGCLHAGPVPQDGMASDLSDLAATAAGLVHPGELVRFLRSYFGQLRLGQSEKRFVRDLIPSVKRKIEQERHRVAIGGAMDWVQRRVDGGRASGRPRVASIDAFLSALDGMIATSDSQGGRVRFTFESGDGAQENAIVALERGTVMVHRGGSGEADLHVTTDPDAWLSIVNGEANAFELIRQHRVKLDGNTKLLPVLAKLLDAVKG